MSDALQRRAPGVVVAPMILVAFTDNWVFRRCGLHGYGFRPFILEPLVASPLTCLTLHATLNIFHLSFHGIFVHGFLASAPAPDHKGLGRRLRLVSSRRHYHLYALFSSLRQFPNLPEFRKRAQSWTCRSGRAAHRRADLRASRQYAANPFGAPKGGDRHSARGGATIDPARAWSRCSGGMSGCEPVCTVRIFGKIRLAMPLTILNLSRCAVLNFALVDF